MYERDEIVAGIIEDHEARERERVVEAAATAVLDSVMGMPCWTGRDAGIAISKAIQRRHRTHQQSLISLLVKVLEDYAEAPYDLRNEASVEACQKVAEAVKTQAFPYI